MDERLASIERQLEVLARRVAVLERRLELDGGRVEARGGPVPPVVLPPLGDIPMALGCACLILAGGYLLRSLTGAGYWPASSGALAGAVYSAGWWLAAGLAMRRGRRFGGATLAWCASLMAFPLLWEATGSRALLPQPVAAALWAGFCLGSWVVGLRHRSAAVLSSVAFLGAPTGAGLVLRSQADWPWVAALILVAVAARTWGRRTDLAWMSGVFLGCAGFTVVLMSGAGLMQSAPVWLAPPRLAGVQAAFVLAAVGGGAIRLRAGRPLTAGDALAFVAAAAVALLASRLPWDSVIASRLSAGSSIVIAVLGWSLGRSAPPSTRWLWGVAGAALLLDGTARAFPGASREVAWAALTLLGAHAGLARPHLAWLAPLFGAALCWSTGDVGLALGWHDPAGEAWRAVVRSGATEAVLATSYLMLGARSASSRPGGALRGCLLALAALVAVALALRAAAAGVLAGGLDVRVPAAVRIAAPTAVALGLLFVARVSRLPEARIVGLAVLVAAALQVVGRDLLGGSPARRVAGFLVLGGGLIGAPLLLRRRDPNAEEQRLVAAGRPCPGTAVSSGARQL